MIKQETDSVFYLENAIIKPSKDEKKRFETSSILTEPKKDIYDSIHVRKRLKLENKKRLENISGDDGSSSPEVLDAANFPVASSELLQESSKEILV